MVRATTKHACLFHSVVGSAANNGALAMDARTESCVWTRLAFTLAFAFALIGVPVRAGKANLMGDEDGDDMRVKLILILLRFILLFLFFSSASDASCS